MYVYIYTPRYICHESMLYMYIIRDKGIIYNHRFWMGCDPNFSNPKLVKKHVFRLLLDGHSHLTVKIIRIRIGECYYFFHSYEKDSEVWWGVMTLMYTMYKRQ